MKIVTPEQLILEQEDLDSITVPTADGEITLLPHHIPLVSQITPGEIILRKEGRENSLVTTNGFLKIDPQGYVTILADYAIRSEEIEIAKVEEAKRKAEEAMKEKVSERDFAIAEAELRRTLLELKVAQKRRAGGAPKV